MKMIMNLSMKMIFVPFIRSFKNFCERESYLCKFIVFRVIANIASLSHNLGYVAIAIVKLSSL